MDQMQQQYNKLKIIVNLRAVQNLIFIKICLAKIKVAKEILLLELE